MKKFGDFLARESPLFDAPLPTPSDDSPLELDEDLFSGRGAAPDADNEALLSLLADASARIDELDAIRDVFGRLVDPIGKVLHTIESEKAAKTALQTTLDNSRTAYGKLRNEHADLEKHYAEADAERRKLRQELTTARGELKTTENNKVALQRALEDSRASYGRLRNEHVDLEQRYVEAAAERQTLHEELAAARGELKTAETGKTELASEAAACRTQLAELETRFAADAEERKTLVVQNRRLNERLQAAAKRIMTLDAELNGTRQQLQASDDEKRATQSKFERVSSESAKLARKLADSEASLDTARKRVHDVEVKFAALSAEQTRLAVALEQANEQHGHELAGQRTRFEALQARSQAGERVLVEAREHLIARGEEINAKEHRLSKLAAECDSLQIRLNALEAERVARETKFQELAEERNSLRERIAAMNQALGNKQAALAHAEENIAALNERLDTIEGAQRSERQSTEDTIAEIKASLRREEMTRSVVEEALETARKDFSRVARELAALKREREADVQTRPVVASAA